MAGAVRELLRPGVGRRVGDEMKTRPLLSTDGGYQRPPPLLIFGLPKSLAPSVMVLNFQIVLPVAASSAQTMPSGAGW